MHLGARGEDPGPEGLLGGRGTWRCEDHGHLLGAADADVVGDERLEEAPGPARVVEDQGARHLDLAHGELPEVAGRPVGLGERGGDHCGSSGRRSPGCRPGRSGRRWPGGAAGSSQEAKPLASSVKAMPARSAWRLAHSCPFSQTLAG